ncbi:hypothetical protein C8R45DRAFT_1224143 [Mycena sanguinolenta]|nr:hypothetical protein C8R45DRAFT_1224143 [Mycena sanguinolenta]
MSRVFMPVAQLEEGTARPAPPLDSGQLPTSFLSTLPSALCNSRRPYGSITAQPMTRSTTSLYNASLPSTEYDALGESDEQTDSTLSLIVRRAISRDAIPTLCAEKFVPLGTSALGALGSGAGWRRKEGRDGATQSAERRSGDSQSLLAFAAGYTSDHDDEATSRSQQIHHCRTPPSRRAEGVRTGYQSAAASCSMPVPCFS